LEQTPIYILQAKDLIVGSVKIMQQND